MNNWIPFLVGLVIGAIGGFSLMTYVIGIAFQNGDLERAILERKKEQYR